MKKIKHFNIKTISTISTMLYKLTAEALETNNWSELEKLGYPKPTIFPNFIKKVKCKNNNVSTFGLTLNKIYDVISIEECGGKLYRIIDDNGDNKRYSVDFFEDID